MGLARPYATLAHLCELGQYDVIALKLVSVLVHKESAAVIGGEYLRTVTREAQIPLLVRRICSSGQAESGNLSHQDEKGLREWIRVQKERDFELGRVVNIRGWVLSQTEVRLCALASLL
jgi:hypothetical protein